MADYYLRDKQIQNPTHDVENPSASAISSSSASDGTTRREGCSRSIPKTLKLAFVLVTLSVAVVLIVTFGLQHSSTSGYGGETESVPASAIAPSSTTTESSVGFTSPNEANNTTMGQSLIDTKPNDLNSTTPEYDYIDEIEGELNGTESCNLTDSVQADIVDICTDTQYASRSWVFHLTSMTLCNNGTYFEESIGNVNSADECAQKCVEKYDGQEGVNFIHYPVRGFQYVCDGHCVW